MKLQNTTAGYENIGSIERVVRFTLSYAAIVALMESAITGSTLFAVLNMIAIAIAMTGIAGWDPLIELTRAVKTKMQNLFHTHDHHHGRRV